MIEDVYSDQPTSSHVDAEYFAHHLEQVVHKSGLNGVLTSLAKVDVLTDKIRKQLADPASRKKRLTKPYARFQEVHEYQKQIISDGAVSDFAYLLACLVMLEEFGFKTNHKEVYKEITLNNLHRSKIPTPDTSLIGRSEELSDFHRSLGLYLKNSLLVVGPPGVGKTLLSQHAIHSLSSVRAYQLFPNTPALYDIIAWQKMNADKRPLLYFIDDMSSFQIEQLQYLLQNTTVVATASDSQYQKLVSDNPKLASMFRLLHVTEPEEGLQVEILTQHLNRLTSSHGITWENDLAEQTQKLTKQYMSSSPLPGTGLEMLEEAAILARMEGSPNVSLQHLRAIISRKAKVPVSDITARDKEELAALPEKLKGRVKGQDHAVLKVSRVIQRSKIGFGKRNRPIGSFLFVGPSGVGKTELAKALAQAMFGSDESMVRLDMSEFAETHTVQRLVGAPPGYVGFEEGGQLTNPIRDKPYNLVLLDEIEKAHPRVFDIFLQVLDDGRLTDGQGKLVDFRNTLIVATSNAGIEDILDMINEGKTLDDIDKEMKDILQDYYRIEFINRFDGIILFDVLKPPALEAIAHLQIGKLQSELAEHQITLTVNAQSITKMANDSFDPRYGARGLIRYIQENVENPLAEMIISGKIQSGQHITL